MRTYGQYCGFSRALEMVGERWALLIVRDLLVGPKRFTDLHRGLPGIPTNILTARLKELEEAGLLRRRVMPRPSGSVVYELTAYGLELESAIVALGRWGAKSLGEPRVGEVVTPDSMQMALRSTFQPDAANGRPISFELRLGDVVIHARVSNGALVVGEGPLPGADLTIEGGPDVKSLLTGKLRPADAIARKIVRVKGNAKLLKRFSELFRIDPMPPSLSA